MGSVNDLFDQWKFELRQLCDGRWGILGFLDEEATDEKEVSSVMDSYITNFRHYKNSAQAFRMEDGSVIMLDPMRGAIQISPKKVSSRKE